MVDGGCWTIGLQRCVCPPPLPLTVFPLQCGTAAGPSCLPGPNDTDATPNKCEPGESGVGINGKCRPCPGTPGSDCSRCDNTNCGAGDPSFPPPYPNYHHTDGHAVGTRDVVKVPEGLKPGKYVLGFRYDCEATAQVWNSCSDITLVA